MKFLHTLSKSGLLVALLMLLASAAWSQRTVRGKVTDAESGEALIGATVSVVGTTRGSTTDIDGNYTVEVPEGAQQLRFAYTGYAEMTITLGSSNEVLAALKPGTLLDEVVVVGYGTVKKSDATGAVTSITEQNFNRNVVAPEQLIQGRAAGVSVTNNSGEPGAGINIRIRGTTSVRSGNNPLFVVDGVPLGGDETTGNVNDGGIGTTAARNPLNFLNPSDIASIDILKDASATPIYGSRGANGVVIITTKSGQAGKGVLEYGYTLGIAQIAKKYDVLGRDEFVRGWSNLNPGVATSTVDFGKSTDWQDEVTRTGFSSNHNLSFGNGDSKGDYRFSLGYLDQDGIIINSGIKRVSGRFNGSRKFLDDRLKLGTNFVVSQTHDDGVPITENAGFEGDLWANALKANPTAPVYNADGSLRQVSNSEPNPVAMYTLSKDYTNTLRALGNINAEVKIFDGLTFKTLLGYDRSVSGRKTAYSRDLLAGQDFFGHGSLFINNIDNSNKLWENYFTYTNDFGNVDLTAMAGYSYQKFVFNQERYQFTNFRTADVNLMINNFAAAAVKDANGNLQPSIVPINSSLFTDELQSYFGRVNLGIRDKYLFTATLRADGSTKFGSGNKYGYFPSFAFKWRMAEESFVPDLFSDLALRLGYGETGNQAIPHNLYQERQRYGDWNIDNGNSVGGGGLSSVAFPNPDLKWETTTQTNIGVDFAFWNFRVSGSIDLYQKNTKDLLIKVVSAQPAVNPFVWKNLDANVQNQGVELSLDVVAVKKDKFNWRVSANGAYNKNEVKDFAGLINTGRINGQGLSEAFAERIAEGQPLFAFFVREFVGFDENGVTIYNGDYQKFVDASPIPKFTAGLTNNFSYGDLDLSIFFYGQFGHYVYNNTANALFTAGALGNGRNVTTDVIGNGESRLNAPDVSTRFLEKANFIRLQDLTIGYNVPLKSKYVSNLRVFASGQNLALFTKYSGLDPEVNVNKQIDDVPSLGIDYNAYPRARTYAIGANISF